MVAMERQPHLGSVRPANLSDGRLRRASRTILPTQIQVRRRPKARPRRRHPLVGDGPDLPAARTSSTPSTPAAAGIGGTQPLVQPGVLDVYPKLLADYYDVSRTGPHRIRSGPARPSRSRKSSGHRWGSDGTWIEDQFFLNCDRTCARQYAVTLSSEIPNYQNQENPRQFISRPTSLSFASHGIPRQRTSLGIDVGGSSVKLALVRDGKRSGKRRAKRTTAPRPRNSPMRSARRWTADSPPATSGGHLRARPARCGRAAPCCSRSIFPRSTV